MANESKWLNFQNYVVVNIHKGEVNQTELTGLLTGIFCKTKTLAMASLRVI